ncbi:MAG: N-formylglutamate amidohydrolase [Hyphomicrobiales bacterium]
MVNSAGNHSVILVCEHASAFIPERFDSLGLSDEAQRSHIAWDLGAFETAKHMAEKLDAPLVSSKISRLVYDCNRPPEATDAMPETSEVYTISGNQNLSDEQKNERIEACYRPFEQLLSDVLDKSDAPTVLITIHSFTPVYKGEKRAVEIGVLHDDDDRFADALMQVAAGYDIRLNQPYGKQDGVTHTLALHGVQRGLLNVMLEVRSDLIATSKQCNAMADTLVSWIEDAVKLCVDEPVTEVAQ